MATHARRASATVANRFSQSQTPTTLGPFPDPQRGTNLLNLGRRLSLSSASFVKVTALSTHLKKILNTTFSPNSIQLLNYLHQLLVLQLHQTQLLVRWSLTLSQLNAALQLLSLMGSRAGPHPLWENASLKVTSMVSINLALSCSSVCIVRSLRALLKPSCNNIVSTLSCSILHGLNCSCCILFMRQMNYVLYESDPDCVRHGPC